MDAEESTFVADFANWIYATELSLAFQGQSPWLVPTMQSIHLVAIAAILSSVLMISLRVLGLASRHQSMAETVRRFMPWVWISAVVLLITGSILVITEPVRALVNVYFWIKMALIVLALVVAAMFQRSVARGGSNWDGLSPQTGMRVATFAVFAVWCGVIFAGRWIGYAE